MAIIGAVFVTLIVMVVVFWAIGLPWLALGFAGPTLLNWIFMVLGVIVASASVYGWWYFIGTKIHLGFG